jgi:NADH:ubiquinone oxidoreductase subunit E
MRNNYNLLKWLINYSRFSAKLLPRLQDHLQCEVELKQPFVELTARLLHLTISKLNRVEEFHQQLALSHFGHFKKTTRFAKIQAVTS